METNLWGKYNKKYYQIKWFKGSDIIFLNSNFKQHDETTWYIKAPLNEVSEIFDTKYNPDRETV